MAGGRWQEASLVMVRVRQQQLLLAGRVGMKRLSSHATANHAAAQLAVHRLTVLPNNFMFAPPCYHCPANGRSPRNTRMIAQMPVLAFR